MNSYHDRMQESSIPLFKLHRYRATRQYRAVPHLFKQEARDADEALTELGKFLNYVRTGAVNNLLPSELHDISVRNASEVAEWQERIESVRRATVPRGPTSRFWLDLLGEVFSGARQRLDELVRARHQRGRQVQCCPRRLSRDW